MESKSLTLKKQKVDQIVSDFKDSQSVSIVEYRGLTVVELETLRNELRKEEVEMHVLKNRLVKIAADKLGYEQLDEQLVGPNAYVFSKKDVVVGPKTLVKFARKHEKLVIKGGIVDGAVVNSDELKTIAKLPNKEGMLSMLLSALTAPVRSFALAAKAIAEQKEQN